MPAEPKTNQQSLHQLDQVSSPDPSILDAADSLFTSFAAEPPTGCNIAGAIADFVYPRPVEDSNQPFPPLNTRLAAPSTRQALLSSKPSQHVTYRLVVLCCCGVGVVMIWLLSKSRMHGLPYMYFFS